MDISCEALAYALALVCPAAYVTIKYALRRVTHLGRGKVVVITGASSGIGRCCAKDFYDRGCQVVLCSRNVTKLEKVKEELISSKSNAREPIVIPLDVSNEESIKTAVKAIEEKFPNGIHILINNAGMSYRGEIITTSMEVQRQVMETNYFGQIAMAKKLLPSLLRVPGKKGTTRSHILSVNSIQGIISIPQRSAYSASKFACTSFFDCLRAELSGFGIRVCSVYPAYVNTDISYSSVRGDGSCYGKMDKNQATGMDPEYVSAKIVEAIEYNKEEVILSSALPKFAIWLRFLFPFIFFRAMDRRAKRKVD